MKAIIRGHLIAGMTLALATALGFAGWRWADHLYLAGTHRIAFWIGILGTALPTLALAAGGMSLRRSGAAAEASAAFAWIVPVFALTFLYLTFVVVFSFV